MRADRESGQALPLVMLAGAALVLGGLGMFWVGRIHASQARAQTAADLTAISAGRRLRELSPVAVADAGRGAVDWRGDVHAAARAVARRNDVSLVAVRWPEGSAWPATTVEVVVRLSGPAGTTIDAAARAAVGPGAGALPETGERAGPSGQYSGPLVRRDGKPMCPAAAAAFDRMDAAARIRGIDLVVTSGFRTDAEQAVLFRRHPDPRWVAPPGRSRHRHATELDIAGTPGAWAWLASHARAYGFLQRYGWEPWHYGYLPGCGGHVPIPRSPAPGDLPGWVPARYRALVTGAALAGGIPPVVLAALLQAESGYRPWAVSPAGAQGIAQFMPATARGVGLRNPFDPAQAIPAAARLLGGHLRAFGTIPLALAAYNAGGGAVRRYGGIPPYRETRRYVARIMALAGDPTQFDPAGAAAGVLLVRMGDRLA